MYTQKVPHTDQGFMQPTNYAGQLAGAAQYFRHTTLNTIVLHVCTLTLYILRKQAYIITWIHIYTTWHPSQH